MPNEIQTKSKTPNRYTAHLAWDDIATHRQRKIPASQGKQISNQKQDKCSKLSEISRDDHIPNTSGRTHESPSAFRLEQVLPASRLPKERIATTFLRLLLIALALLQCLPGSSLTHYLTTDAVFGPAVEPESVGQGTAAPARPSVFTETCSGCRSGSAFRAALITVVELAWLRHGWGKLT